MGLLQKAYETYEFHKDLIGKTETGADPLAPCSHMPVHPDLEITVDQSGAFISASAFDKKAPKVLIPVTEGSAGRSGKNPQPHPLCDQLAYLNPGNEGKYRLYTDRLRAWTRSSFSHPKLPPILHYVEGGTIVQDLLHAGIIKLKDGKIENEKLMVCWQVIGLGLEGSGPSWTDPSLFSAFDAYYRNQRKEDPAALCMVTGDLAVPARQHLKGVVAMHGNAKLISANDSSNFTYRGRFTAPSEVETVGYEASQKAHNALRWLVANQSTAFGGRFFICWEPRQLRVPNPALALLAQMTPGLELPEQLTPSDYQDSLQKTLNGWKSILPSESAQAVIASFDAATSGRLAITYYNELQASDFLNRLFDWDAHCCWLNGKFGVQSPSVYQIVSCAFGVQKTEKGITKLVVDDRLLRQEVQRLISCRIDRARIPADLILRLTQRCSAPLCFEPGIRAKMLFTACAVIRKYRYDKYKEEWNMALETEKKDRSYQFGRLLAVLEKVERDTYSSDEKREPNAIRMLSVFSRRPQYAARIIWERVWTAYYPRLKPGFRAYYSKLLAEIQDRLSQFDDREQNRPLSETYLMGYYLQRRELYMKKENGGTDQ